MPKQQPFETVPMGAFGERGGAQIGQAYFDQVIAPFIGALWFEEAASITLAGSATRTLVVSTTIPHGTFAVLRHVGHQLVNPAGWSDVRWSIERNQAPIHPWGNIQMQLATPQSPRNVFHILKGPDVVRWVATNLTASAIPGVGAMLAGWLWRQK